MPRLGLVLTLVAAVAACSAAPPALRLYIFDTGEITGLAAPTFRRGQSPQYLD